MRLTSRDERTQVPGTRETKSRISREWICPECDYFEEAEAGEE